MYCSDKQFIDIALNTGVTSGDLHDMIKVVAWLHHHRWSLIKSKKFKTVLDNDFTEVVKMIELLESVDKIDARSLKWLLSHVDASWSNPFEITWPSHELIQKKLQEQFGDVETIQNTSNDESLQVSWNWWWYKRSLSKDLDKILK
jgi:hypothetical protein